MRQSNGFTYMAAEPRLKSLRNSNSPFTWTASSILVLSILIVSVLYSPIWRDRNDLKSDRRPRVLCMFLPAAISSIEDAEHSYRTWAAHCDQVAFIGDELHGELETIVLKKEPSWQRLKDSFKYIYEHYFEEADWFLKVDYFNFVVMENLHHLLRNYSADTPIYFGFKLKNKENEPYMNGPTGYVLSKEALRRLAQEALPNGALCRQEEDGDEDEEMGYCMRNVGVIAGDSRSADGSYTFLPFPTKDYFSGLTSTQREWFKEHSYYNATNNVPKLSKHVIAFSMVFWPMKYNLYYFMYNLTLFGVNHKNKNSADVKTLKNYRSTARR